MKNPHWIELPFHYLKPGEMFLGEKPTLVKTILGSCVAVTMFSPCLGVGSVSHGLLPACKGRKSCSCDMSCNEGYRYVECSIRLMLEGFLKRGVTPGEIEVKVFGGSDMFTGSDRGRRSITVGRQNVHMALQIIREKGLKLIVSDLGGDRGRKIFFSTHTGEVLLKRMHKSEIDD